jgi:hypothetical protein
VCEADEEIKKTKNKNNDAENPNLNMEFTTLKLLLKINKS